MSGEKRQVRECDATRSGQWTVIDGTPTAVADGQRWPASARGDAVSFRRPASEHRQLTPAAVTQ